MTEPRPTNRLIHEKSPYLLQHAHNPVDWYPWAEEAFEAAATQDKPIFLSIGYATCHWCHVMEKEVFENDEIAKQMNETFINIKVDREEMPDVDSLYMEFAQTMLAGVAGWPLNMVLTPDLEPFFAVTYVPAVSQPGLMGMPELIARMRGLWDSEERMRVVQQARAVVQTFQEGAEQVMHRVLPGARVLDSAAEMFFKIVDPIYGGISGELKFPIAYQNSFLLRYARMSQDSRAMFCAERTLQSIVRGGIWDHIGGGFCRYAVDPAWTVPHFEKMLYDNAMLASGYCEGWKVTRNPLYRQIGESTLRYALRELKQPEGAFSSAEDADSEGEEGRFYTWTPEEIIRVLGTPDGPHFCELYGITAEGNFEGRSVLHLGQSLAQFAGGRGMSVADLQVKIEEWHQQLFLSREQRERPFKDDKVLTSWNGLMIHALAEGGAAYDQPDFLRAAIQTAEFIHKELWIDKQLLRRWRKGEARFSGTIDDYAFMIRGLLTLFEVSGQNRWLSWAIELSAILDRDFSSSQGAFYQGNGQDPHLLVRRSAFTDGAEPSGNGVHLENLLRLHQITWNPRYREQAEGILRAIDPLIEGYPVGYCYHLLGLQRYTDAKSATAVIALNKEQEYRDTIAAALFCQYLPHTSVVWKVEGDEEVETMLPYTEDYVVKDGKTTFYVCRQGVCEAPLTELSAMLDAIAQL